MLGLSFNEHLASDHISVPTRRIPMLALARVDPLRQSRAAGPAPTPTSQRNNHPSSETKPVQNPGDYARFDGFLGISDPIPHLRLARVGHRDLADIRLAGALIYKDF